jgi:hypothetical protein
MHPHRELILTLDLSGMSRSLGLVVPCLASTLAAPTYAILTGPVEREPLRETFRFA